MMSSHYEWGMAVVAQHDRLKPFAPENGEPLRFMVGDPVVFTNDYGVTFKFRVTGFYRPEEPCSLYACGRRYLIDSDSPWFPVKEAQLQLDEERAKEAVMVPQG
jgi:hypothetical protein